MAKTSSKATANSVYKDTSVRKKKNAYAIRMSLGVSKVRNNSRKNFKRF